MTKFQIRFDSQQIQLFMKNAKSFLSSSEFFSRHPTVLEVLALVIATAVRANETRVCFALQTSVFLHDFVNSLCDLFCQLRKSRVCLGTPASADYTRLSFYFFSPQWGSWKGTKCQQIDTFLYLLFALVPLFSRTWVLSFSFNFYGKYCVVLTLQIFNNFNICKGLRITSKMNIYWFYSLYHLRSGI